MWMIYLTQRRHYSVIGPSGGEATQEISCLVKEGPGPKITGAQLVVVSHCTTIYVDEAIACGIESYGVDQAL